MIHALVNLVGFQIGWLACVCGAASGWPWVGPIVVAVLLVTHLIRMNVARKELQFICTVALLGWLIDTMQGALGTLSFSGNPFPDWISPPWMVALWINFALMLINNLHIAYCKVYHIRIACCKVLCIRVA